MEIQWHKKSQTKGTAWSGKLADRPCVRLQRRTLTLSPAAMKAFSLKDGDMVCIGQTDACMYLKVAEDQNEVENAYRLSQATPNSTGRLLVTAFVKELESKGIAPDAVFELAMNSVRKLIVADLTKPI